MKLQKRVIADHRESPSPWCLLPLNLDDLGATGHLNMQHGGSVCVMTRSQVNEEEALVDGSNQRVANDDDVHVCTEIGSLAEQADFPD